MARMSPPRSTERRRVAISDLIMHFFLETRRFLRIPAVFLGIVLKLSIFRDLYAKYTAPSWQ